MTHFPSRYGYKSSNLWVPGTCQLSKEDRCVQDVVRKFKDPEDAAEKVMISIRVSDIAIEKMMVDNYEEDAR